MQVGPNECDDIICPNCSGIVGFNAMANYSKNKMLLSLWAKVEMEGM